MKGRIHSLEDNYIIIVPVKDINPQIHSKIQEIGNNIYSLVNVENSQFTRDKLSEEIHALLMEEIK